MRMGVTEVQSLQQQLKTVIGEQYESYLSSMRDWFGQKITKDFFDESMASILTTEEGLEIHNEIVKQLLFLSIGKAAPPPNLMKARKNKMQEMRNINSNKAVARSIGMKEYQEGHGQLRGEDAELMVHNQSETHGETQYITMNFVESEECEAPEDDPLEIKPDVDWLFAADIVKVKVEDLGKGNVFAPIRNYTDLILALKEQKPSDLLRNKDRVSNITHGYEISDRLNKQPHLRPYFKQPPKEQPQAYLPGGSTVHGRFLLKAWECGLDGGVDPNSTKFVIASVREHIKRIITEVAKQRRVFRMRDDKLCHSIGAPYPNPYLRQGHLLFDKAYTTESTKLADVMHVPKLLPTSDELERIAALQVSASLPPKPGRFPASRATLADLLNVIENEPSIIPYSSLRLKLTLTIGQKYRGYGGSNNYSDNDDQSDDFLMEDEDEEDEDSSRLMPVCSY